VVIDWTAPHRFRPAISICALDRVLFRDALDYHLSFRLRCDQRDLVLHAREAGQK
jgi:hypothetical protein